jgi:hypothetical protein
MPAQHIRVADLIKHNPAASCCDCGKEAAEAPQAQVWTIWNGTKIYCPRCASSEGIGPND